MGHQPIKPDRQTLDRIREEFRHDPKTGELFRRVGTLTHGRLVVRAGAQNRLVSHIVWFLAHGRWPEEMLDHTNQNSLDNRPANLREVTHSQNLANSKQRQRPLPAGVYAKRGRFQARISSKGALRTLGTFATPEEAEQAFIVEHLRRFGAHSRYFKGKIAQRFSS